MQDHAPDHSEGTSHEAVEDGVLEARIRRAAARVVREPLALDVDVHAGIVNVHGLVFDDEIDALQREVDEVPGVHQVSIDEPTQRARTHQHQEDEPWQLTTRR